MGRGSTYKKRTNRGGHLERRGDSFKARVFVGESRLRFPLDTSDPVEAERLLEKLIADVASGAIKPPAMATCHPSRLSKADGLCSQCYRESRPMAECHQDKRMYCLGLCRSCYEIDLRARNPEFAERQRVNCRQWSAVNVERIKEIGRRWRETHVLSKEQKQDRRLRSEYGITADDVERMAAAQLGVCAICLRAPDDGLCVDHCHATGIVRGLLCRCCNLAIGCLRDEPDAMIRAADYVRGFQCKIAS